MPSGQPPPCKTSSRDLVLVRRHGGQREIDATDLVVDDIAVLTAGDRIPADGVAVEAQALEVNTSLITGESVPVTLDVGAPLTGGTFVEQGEALMRITAVGASTRLAGLAELTRSVERPTSPLEGEMRRVVRMISIIAISTGLAFLVISLVGSIDFQDAATFAIGVSVALVPEALLPTVTLSLALGAQRIAKRHAVVRHLESVETLGSVTFICTDKTGTLTRNQMQVVQVWTPDGVLNLDGEGYGPTATITGSDSSRAAATSVALAARVCSNGRVVQEDGAWVSQGDPMEAAIDALVLRLGLSEPHPPARLFPFDPRRRRMSVLSDGQVFVKGAADTVLPLCLDDTSDGRGRGPHDGCGRPPSARHRLACLRRHRTVRRGRRRTGSDSAGPRRALRPGPPCRPAGVAGLSRRRHQGRHGDR